jgi:MHS family proline/betaine transporter-like MFS transporter
MINADVAPSLTAVPASSVRRAVIAGAFGSVMEWYDLVTYGYLAQFIGHAFFPSGDSAVSLLAAFATFGVGFLARPLGGLIFGTYSDRHGRKASLLLTMILMAAATALIGFLPTYAMVGVAAPLLLVIARIVQGASAGGEGTTALAFLVEWAPRGHRGSIGSLQSVASGTGLLLGSATLSITTALLSTAEMQSWGWRIPFLIGILVGPLGLWIRRSVDETPAFRQALVHDTTVILAKPWVLAAKAFVFLIFWSVAYYVFLTFIPTFSQRYLHIAGKQVFLANTVALVAYIILIPVFGHLSDRIGRKPLLLLSCICFVVLPYPVFKLLLAGVSMSTYILVTLMFTALLAMYSGPAGATVAEMFPTRIRSKWLGIGYGLSVAIFGGFTPFVVTWLIRALDSPLAPAYYVIAAALIGGIFILFLKETAKDELG